MAIVRDGLGHDEILFDMFYRRHGIVSISQHEIHGPIIHRPPQSVSSTAMLPQYEREQAVYRQHQNPTNFVECNGI